MLTRDEQDLPARTRGTADLLLEVVHGPRAGARVRLDVDRALRIGHDYDNDVVLRHPSTAGVRVSLTLGADGVVAVEVETGSIGLFGVAVEAGRRVALPRWAPFSIGDAMLAAGPDDAGAWRACRRLARESAAARRATLPATAAAGGARDTDPADTDAEDADMAAADGARAVRRWPLAVALAALPVLAVAGWLVAQPGSTSRASVAASAASVAPEPVRAWLSAEGFGQLRVQRQPAGPPRVEGLVDRDEDRVRIAAGLGAAGLAATLDVNSGEQVARQVADVLRLNGVRAEVRHIGRGVVHARLHEGDPDRRARAEAAVKRDVRGLADLSVELGDTGRRAPAPAVATTDPGKRVVTVVYGRGGYVVTVDGARYFEGALLPSGHRIARIADASVELERDGRTSRLAL